MTESMPRESDRRLGMITRIVRWLAMRGSAVPAEPRWSMTTTERAQGATTAQPRHSAGRYFWATVPPAPLADHATDAVKAAGMALLPHCHTMSLLVLRPGDRISV